jgi:hypothetical protein
LRPRQKVRLCEAKALNCGQVHTRRGRRQRTTQSFLCRRPRCVLGQFKASACEIQGADQVCIPI